MASTHRNEALAALWRHAGRHDAALEAVTLTGAEPVLPSSFAVGTAAQISIAAAALAAAELWRLRTGRQQRVGVDMRDAGIEFRSEHYMRAAGQGRGEIWDKIAGLYRCGDGRWVRLHTNFPHHRDGVLKLLGCDYTREAVQRALDSWQAVAFETAAAEAGLVVTGTRSFAEWDAHGQGRAVAGLPVFSIERIGDAPPQPLPSGDRPLAGVRVLDLTRVIAGPVCGRTLAVHGADVLLVTAAHLPQMMPLVMDSGRGKLSTFVDLREPSGRETLADLARDRGCNSAEVMIDIAVEDGLETRFTKPPTSNQDRSRLTRMIQHPSVLIGASDAGAHVRGFSTYGDTAVVFDDFVRRDGVLTLEHAVKRLTSDLATAWNLPNRGLLRPGYAADIAVFDPATIARGPELDVADMPTGCARYFRGSVGVDATVINGNVAWTNTGGYAPTFAGTIASRRTR